MHLHGTCKCLSYLVSLLHVWCSSYLPLIYVFVDQKVLYSALCFSLIVGYVAERGYGM